MKEIISDKVTWIDIIAPKEQELEALKKEIGLPSSLIDELRTPSLRDKVKVYEKFIYTVLYFPIWNEITKISEPVELDLIMNDKYFITIRYDSKLQPINDLMKRCESLTKSGCNILLGDATYKTLYALMEELLDFSARQLKHIEDKLVKIEERVFCKDQREDLIYNALGVKRDLIDFKRIFTSLHSCLDAVEFRGEYFWGSEAKAYLLDLHHDNDRVWGSLQHHLEFIDSLETTMYTLIDNKINNLNRIFTFISFMTFPAVMVFSWYQTGMNGLPFLNLKYGAYFLLGVAMIEVILAYMFLRKKRLI